MSQLGPRYLNLLGMKSIPMRDETMSSSLISSNVKNTDKSRTFRVDVESGGSEIE